jgi:hypothetical protein
MLDSAVIIILAELVRISLFLVEQQPHKAKYSNSQHDIDVVC